MQRTASVALVRRCLAGRILTGLGPTRLAVPIGAKAPRNALLKVAIYHTEISASYGFYYTQFLVALRGLGGLVRVPWSASNLLTQIESRQN